MLKHDELEDPASCLNKAADDEPIFVLRAQDKIAPMVIELWAALAAEMGADEIKLSEALEIADYMRSWPTRKWPD